VWVDGWRNLHHTRAALEAELLVEGKGSVGVSRAWAGGDLATNQAKCVGPDKKASSLDALGWSDALVTFRPFLSYNELGSLLEEGPSKLYNALSKVLGLEDLVAMQARLANARKARHALSEQAGAGADELKQMLDAVEDGSGSDRIERARKALKTSVWDLAALEKLTLDSGLLEGSQTETLRRIASLEPVDVNGVGAVVKALRAAARAVADLAGTNAERSRHQANILDQALAFHAKHAGQDCPVCKAPGALSNEWADAARKEIASLRKAAAACDAADAAVKTRIREAQRYLAPPPAFLAEAKDVGVAGLPEVRRLWTAWASGRDLDDPAKLTEHMESRVLEFAEGVEKLAANAAEEHARLEDVWRPIALAIAGWILTARTALAAKDTIKQIKAAEEWWKDTSAAVRDERFAPIAERARAVWSQLRLQSNVDLGGVALEGTAQRRKVTLQVTVDGTPAEALGVMSQGELHSLALSLFLPRATLPESPFRFICIDDPVQSMDPARVEGLARVLADAARTRQVIVSRTTTGCRKRSGGSDCRPRSTA
jgi:hypothetical protein